MLFDSDVERICQGVLVVGSHIDQHRQAVGRMDPSGRNVKIAFADGNAHAPCTLITQPEDPLPVSDHDQHHIGEGCVGQNTVDMMDIGWGDVKSARPPVNVTEFEAGLAHSGGIDDRKHLLQMIQKKPEKKGFHSILQGKKVDVFIQVVGFVLEMAVAPAGLDFQGGNRLREKSEQLEGLTFFLGKRGPFVVDGVFDQAPSLERDLDIFLTCEWITLQDILQLDISS